MAASPPARHGRAARGANGASCAACSSATNSTIRSRSCSAERLEGKRAATRDLYIDADDPAPPPHGLLAMSERDLEAHPVSEGHLVGAVEQAAAAAEVERVGHDRRPAGTGEQDSEPSHGDALMSPLLQDVDHIGRAQPDDLGRRGIVLEETAAEPDPATARAELEDHPP